MLLVMCRKVENNKVLRIVKTLDPDAFVSVGSVMGVYGKGFETIEVNSSKKKKREMEEAK
jgi:uncharacterized membrane-anchored protein YitT (DUF2179 family)